LLQSTKLKLVARRTARFWFLAVILRWMAADFFPLIAVFSPWRAVVTQAHRSALYLQSTEGSTVRQKERV